MRREGAEIQKTDLELTVASFKDYVYLLQTQPAGLIITFITVSAFFFVEKQVP
jgi:hypothetical protein